MSKNIIKRYSLETLSDVEVKPRKVQPLSSGTKRPSILEQIQSMPAENAVKTTSKKSPPKKPTSQLSPRPTRKPRRTIQEEREIIQKIINELFTRKKEQETIEAKAQGLLSTEKENQENLPKNI